MVPFCSSFGFNAILQCEERKELPNELTIEIGSSARLVQCNVFQNNVFVFIISHRSKSLGEE